MRSLSLKLADDNNGAASLRGRGARLRPPPRADDGAAAAAMCGEHTPHRVHSPRIGPSKIGSIAACVDELEIR